MGQNLYNAKLMKQEGFVSFTELHGKMDQATKNMGDALAAQRSGDLKKYLELTSQVQTELKEIEIARLKNQEIMNSLKENNQ